MTRRKFLWNGRCDFVPIVCGHRGKEREWCIPLNEFESLDFASRKNKGRMRRLNRGFDITKPTSDKVVILNPYSLQKQIYRSDIEERIAA